MSAIPARELLPGHTLPAPDDVTGPRVITDITADLFSAKAIYESTWKGFPCSGFLDFELGESVDVIAEPEAEASRV